MIPVRSECIYSIQSALKCARRELKLYIFTEVYDVTLIRAWRRCAVQIHEWMSRNKVNFSGFPCSGSREQWTLCREHVNRNTVHAWSALLTSWLSESGVLTKRDMQNMQSGGARGLELRTSALTHRVCYCRVEYSRLFSNGIANCIFNCIFHMWVHKLWHSPNAIANLALPFEFSLSRMQRDSHISNEKAKSIRNCISHVLWAMSLSYLNSNVNYHICFFTFSTSCM